MRLRYILGLVLLAAAAAGPAEERPAGSTGAAADGLAQEIRALLERPAARRAFWGAQAVWLDSGETFYELNADKLFTPASTAKLYSTALALERLGPEYRFTTRVAADTAVLPDGSLPGDLRLIGGGDPNLSARVIPYDADIEFGDDLLSPIRELARQVQAAGVQRIQGAVVGDDTRYVWQPYPPGWSMEDAVWGYGAPVSALSFNDNQIEIRIRPGPAAGLPARLRLKPPVEYYRILNRTRTLASRTVPRRLDVGRSDVGRELELWGDISIRSPGREMSVAVDDPALFAAVALREELERLGVRVEGEARSEHAWPHSFADLRSARPPAEREFATELAGLRSAPLGLTLMVVNKESVNLHAEMLLRETAWARRGVGGLEAGVEELRDFLRSIGLSPWEFFLGDGSGLSRKDLVSPAGTVKLLRAMQASENGEIYRRSLAVAGVDGTLDWRFSRTAAKQRIQAKTGTLSHVTALAGYGTAKDGRPFAFAIFVNNFGVSTSYVRNLVDRMVLALAGLRPEGDRKGR